MNRGRRKLNYDPETGCVEFRPPVEFRVNGKWISGSGWRLIIHYRGGGQKWGVLAPQRFDGLDDNEVLEILGYDLEAWLNT